ncbi:MAG TPA: outer membrane beta-barrel protein [Chthoniobacterales bacterium]
MSTAKIHSQLSLLSSKSPKLFLAAAAALGLVATSYSQDIIRPSMTRAYAPDNREFVEEEPNYNMRVGSVSFLMDASLFAEYNDNINLSSVDQESDVIIRPSLGVTAKWELSDVNNVTLRVGAGYAFYMSGNNGGGTGFTLDPGSEIALNIYSGDFKIRIYDAFSLSDTPVDSIGFSDVANFGQFSNTIGIAVTWDISDFAISVGYSHNDLVTTSGDFSYLDRSTDQVYGSIYYALNPTWGAGIEGAYSLTRYDENVQNDASGFHLGVFLEGTLTENFSFRAAMGYQSIKFDDRSDVASAPGVFGNLGNDTEDYSGTYANLGITHQVNAYITQDITIGREGLLGINSNFIELFYVRHTAKFAVSENLDLTTRLFYEKSTESGDFLAEDANRYGASIGTTYQIAPNWILSGEYGYIKKDSNLDARDYTQNRVLVGLTYQF